MLECTLPLEYDSNNNFPRAGCHRGGLKQHKNVFHCDLYFHTSLTQATGKALNRKGKRLFHPLRLALTGDMSGPDIGGQLGLLEAGELRGQQNFDPVVFVQVDKSLGVNPPVWFKKPRGPKTRCTRHAGMDKVSQRKLNVFEHCGRRKGTAVLSALIPPGT